MLGTYLTMSLVTAGSLAVTFAIEVMNMSSAGGVAKVGSFHLSDILAAIGVGGALVASGPLALVAGALGLGGVFASAMQRGAFPELRQQIRKMAEPMAMLPDTQAQGDADPSSQATAGRYVRY